MTPKDAFVMGRGYSRREIHDVLGGSLEQYLPSVGGRVVAVCINPDPDLQPFPPAQIFIGSGPTIQARAVALSSQDEPVPVFIGRAAHDWEFKGHWRPVRLETDSDRVEAERTRAGVTRPFFGVLWLEPYSVA
jgi:hypothetical protein